ncbi:MAG: cupredoxin domain-containing protein [Dehalococcoidia bacterium]
MKLPRRLPVAVTIAFALFVFVACAGEERAPAPLAEPLVSATAEVKIAIELRDIAFSEQVLRVAAGQVVELAISNSGTLRHDFTIERIAAQVSASGRQRPDRFDVYLDLQRGQSGVLLLRVTEPGEYIFFCSVPGHRRAGMVGTLVVSGSAAGGG